LPIFAGMSAPTAYTLVNPQTKTLAFSVCPFGDDALFDTVRSYNYFSMVLVTEGSGTVMADVSTYDFSGPGLICFSLYQPFSIKGAFKGVLINFHPDFFCLHKHRHEVSCNGVMFNNIYDPPVIGLSPAETQALFLIAEQFKAEVQREGLAQYEVLVSYLKIFLINASRIKIGQTQPDHTQTGKEPEALAELKTAIDKHFKTLHSPGDYADLLHISVKALNKVCKTHYKKTLSSLIAERIITEAKRELYLTSKAVKLIAYELGFDDEFYFSRFFKSHVTVSPQSFRDTVGFDKANA
jgi:AraC-like DNA-binding protein